MNPRIRTWLNHREQGADLIPIDPKSQTVPDMALSLQELLERHTRGREVPEHHGYYEDDELDDFWPDASRLDMVEIQEMIEANQDHVTALQHKLHKLNSEQRKAELDEYHAQREKESSQSFSDPKQRQPKGGSKSGEADGPPESGGQ